MGLELVGLAITAATTVAGVAQARKAQAAQKESNEISSAMGQIQDRAAKRKALRDARIRRAMITNSAVQSGAEGSSGELGAISALESNTGAAIGNLTGQQIATAGISRANQKAADAESAFDRIGMFGEAAQKGLNLWDSWTDPQGTTQ